MIKEISAADAHTRLEAGDATFIDVRDGGSFRSGHLPGAQSIGDHNINEFIAREDKGRTVVVYCYHGNSSRGGAGYLHENGFEDVYSMTGGFGDWGSRPTEKAPPPPPREPKAAPSEAAAPASEPTYRVPDPRPETTRRRKRDRLKDRLQKAVDDAKALFEFI
jgi:thiosulfate sulfurtransferase